MHIDIDLPETVGALLIALFFAWICARMARSRNREPLVWAALGFFFPCVIPIVLLIIGRSPTHR